MALTEVTSPDVIILDNMFMPERLTKYDRYQVAWWDESHRKCSLVTISGANGCEYITRVCRDRHNNPCLHGTQSEDAPVNVNVKYEKEARFALGVALVRTNEGRTEGRRIPLFDYTEKTIICDLDWRKLCCEANTMVRGGEGLGGWKGDYREGRLYENDALWTKKQSLLKGLGGGNDAKIKRKRTHNDVPIKTYLHG